jgi:diguanylate cyclase (GGDEF)-like protein
MPARLTLPLARSEPDDPASETPLAPYTRLALRAHGPHAADAVAILVIEGSSGLQLYAVAGPTNGEALPLAMIRAQMQRPRRVSVEIPDLAAEPAHAAAPAHERESGFASFAGAIIRTATGTAIGMIGLLDREPRRHGREIILVLADLARGIASLQAARGEGARSEPGLIDAVTGLPGRQALERHLGDLFGAEASMPSFALFRIDFGRLSALNEMYGRDVADRFLRLLADRLQAIAPVPGYLAHLGGSGFAMVAPGRIGPSDTEAIALRMMERLREPIQLDTLDLPVRLSIGIALYPADLGKEAPAPGAAAATVASVLLAADAALAHAKTQGDGRHCRATSAMIGLESDLQQAAAQGAFHLNWMPVIDTATEHVTGFEALVRWNRPGFGAVPPSLFLPVAEAGGLIETIDGWVLRAACIEAQSWDTPLTVAVNVSPVWLSHGRLSRVLRRVLDETGLEPGRLQLEFSERSALDSDGQLGRELSQVRAMGIRLALDDFGSFHSSLGALTRYPFDKVKLDRQFVRALGMTSCAEGVETEAQLAFLDAHGCEEIQGYLLGRPVPELPRAVMASDQE